MAPNNVNSNPERVSKLCFLFRSVSYSDFTTSKYSGIAVLLMSIFRVFVFSFDDMILFEDELADNGISVLNVKIRVMHERLLLLSRFFLRVDDVLVRVIDTRVYVDFTDNIVIREFKKQECHYNELLAKHQRSNKKTLHDPKAALRDSNWVVEHTPLIERKTEIIHF